MRRPWALLIALALAPALAGCASPDEAPDGPVQEPPATTSPAPATLPAASTPSPPPASSTPPSAAPPPEPRWLPDENRTFEMEAKAHEASEVLLLVNATDRALVTLFVRNVEPAARDFGVNVLASGPNGTSASDSGLLPDGGGAFTLRLAPLGGGHHDGPALLRVRLASAVAVIATGRVYVDAEVPAEGGSTVPGA